MKKYCFALFILLAVQLGCFSQNFSKLSEMVNAEAVTNGQVAFFVGTYLGTINENATEQEAFDKLQSEGFFSNKVQAQDMIKLGQLCSLYAKVGSVKGGLFYSITKKSKRYAFREFKAKGWLPKNSDPSMKVAGKNAVNLFNMVSGE